MAEQAPWWPRQAEYTVFRIIQKRQFLHPPSRISTPPVSFRRRNLPPSILRTAPISRCAYYYIPPISGQQRCKPAESVPFFLQMGKLFTKV